MKWSRFIWLEDVFMTGVVSENAKVCHKFMNEKYIYTTGHLSYHVKKIIEGKLIFWHGGTLDQRTDTWKKLISRYHK